MLRGRTCLITLKSLTPYVHQNCLNTVCGFNRKLKLRLRRGKLWSSVSHRCYFVITSRFVLSSFYLELNES